MIAAKRSVRLMLLGSAAAVKRRFCAAVAATSLPADAAVAMADGTKEKQDPRTLKGRLSSLWGAPQGSVTRTLNKWLREGRSVIAVELINYVKELRKFRRYAHALEVAKVASFFALPLHLHVSIFLPV